jgi:hypothetical protein
MSAPSRRKTYKRWTSVRRTPSSFFTFNYHLDHFDIHCFHIRPSSLPTVCLQWLHVEYAVRSISGRNTWGAFPVRKEGPRGVWEDHRTGASLDSSLAITHLTPVRSERRCSLTVPWDVLASMLANHTVTSWPLASNWLFSLVDLCHAPRVCIWGRECAPTLCGKKRGAFPNQIGGPRA